MPFDEAIALQPMWAQYWMNWMTFGAYLLPLALLVWRQSRIVGIVTFVAGLIAGLSINWMYSQMGYVKLLGLPHIIFWTPAAIYMVSQMRRPDMPNWPRRIMFVVLATITVSLAFDYTDAVRYFLGETTPMAGTGANLS